MTEGKQYPPEPRIGPADIEDYRDYPGDAFTDGR